MRPSWDDCWMAVAREVAKRHSCPRRAVGAVIVKDNRLVATGYNGAPPECRTCLEDGCLVSNGHCMRAAHAERNALDYAWCSLNGATLYVTTEPCSRCVSSILSNKISRVVYADAYPDTIASLFIEQSGLRVEQYR